MKSLSDFLYQEPGMLEDYLPPYYTRIEWKAKSSVGELKLMRHPATHLFVTFTRTEICKKNKCMGAVRDIQAQDMANGLPDIAYNFLIGGNGNSYEGRGSSYIADRRGDKAGMPCKCIDIAFIGDYTSKVPPSIMLNAAGDLINYLIQEKILKKKHISISFLTKNIMIKQAMKRKFKINKQGKHAYDDNK